MLSADAPEQWKLPISKIAGGTNSGARNPVLPIASCPAVLPRGQLSRNPPQQVRARWVVHVL